MLDDDYEKIGIILELEGYENVNPIQTNEREKSNGTNGEIKLMQVKSP